MNPRRLVALYPPAWRERYEDEFLALLKERPPRLREVLDIVWGSIDAHFFAQLPTERPEMFMRFTGLTAILAGVALTLAFVPPQVELEGWGSVAGAGVTLFYPLAFLGSIGIHVRLTRIGPNVAWPAFVAIVLGGFVGSSSVTMSMWGGGIPGSDFGILQAIGLWLGSAVMGAAILAIGVIPRPVGMAFVIGSALAVIGPVAGEALSSSGILTGLSRSGVVVYALGWIVAGVSLQVAQPEPGIPGPLAT